MLIKYVSDPGSETMQKEYTEYSFMLPSSGSFLIACCVTHIKVPGNDWALKKAIAKQQSVTKSGHEECLLCVVDISHVLSYKDNLII